MSQGARVQSTHPSIGLDESCPPAPPSLESPPAHGPLMERHFAHISSPPYIIIQYIDSSSVHTPHAPRLPSPSPLLNGQLWKVNMSYHGGLLPIGSTDSGLQCPVDNYNVQCATMYFQLNGLSVTYHFSPGTYIYILLTSS